MEVSSNGHPLFKLHFLCRLQEDMRFFSERENAWPMPQLAGLSDSELSHHLGSAQGARLMSDIARTLSEQLSALQRADVAKLAHLRDDAVASANSLVAQPVPRR